MAAPKGDAGKMTAAEAHGRLGKSEWELPRVVAYSSEANRSDQGNTTNASEWMDSEKVMRAKMAVVADLLRRSSYCVAYTGAGLSRSSGIPDYGSKAEKSVVRAPKIASSLDAEPTYAHRVIVALERAGFIKHYVQQNHDGLPQKAGFPQQKLNEIHGAWFDPSNPVVKFSGSLRTDLFNWMLEAEERADLCLCLGTSLSGMNADRMANTPAKKSAKGAALGTVVINLQRTPLDSRAAVRVWYRLDDAFRELAGIMGLRVVDLTPPPVPCDVQFVPYDAAGIFDPKSRMTLDMRPGQAVRISTPGPSFGHVGTVACKTADGDYVLSFTTYRYRYGRWWIYAAMAGAVPALPVINVDAVVVSATAEAPPAVDARHESEASSETTESMDTSEDGNDVDAAVVSPADAPKPPPLPGSQVAPPKSISVIQSHEAVAENEAHKVGNTHAWGLRIAPETCSFVQSVVWHLHPTFRNPDVECGTAPFEISRRGWGTFEVTFDVTLRAECGGKTIRGSHNLTFSANGPAVKVTNVPTHLP